MISYLGKEYLHAVGILMINDVDKFRQLLTYLGYLTRGVWIEKDFLQEVIILIEHTLGYLHMTFESSTRRILMLHHCCESKGTHKRNTQRVSHRLVMLIKGVFVQTQTQLLIQVLEEYLARVVAFLDDNRILL